MAGRYLSSKNHRPPGTARAANSFKSRSLASWPLCLPAPFGELFGCSAKGKAIATRAALPGLPWSGPASVCASALPAACRALLFRPFRGYFRGFWPAPGIFTRLPAFAPFLRPFVAFLRCLSQYVPPPAALRLLCLPLLPCSAFLKRKGRPASAVVCFAASLPALALPGLPGIRTKDEGRQASLCFSAASLKRAAALLHFACAACLCVCQRTWPGLHLWRLPTPAGF